MSTYLSAPARVLLLAAALAFATQAVETRSATAAQPQTTAARSRSDAAATNSDGTSLDGVLIIAGIVGAVIVLAWVCSRFGDSR